MPLLLQCPHCQKLVQITDDLQGKVFRCGGCKQLFRAGKAPSVTSPPSLAAVPEQHVRVEIPAQPPSQPAVVAPPPSPPEVTADLPRTSEVSLVSPARRLSRVLLIGGIVGVLISLLGAGAIALVVFSIKDSPAPNAAKVPNESVAANVQDPRVEQPAVPKPANPKNDPIDKPPDPTPKEKEEPRGPGVLSAKLLSDLKAATVFVKVEGSGINGSGSGFVAKVEGDVGYVVTNYHVVNPKFEIILPNVRRPPVPRGPNLRRPPGARDPIFRPPQRVVVTVRDAVYTTVFYSGTKNEQVGSAELVLFDPDHDLALLKVPGVRNLPRPIDLKPTDKLVETMPVYVFGYPFGKILATNQGHPAITVGKGSVSSIRTDQNDDVAYVQIDGALNPGNSGGPVVDPEGRLLGIAVATIRGSSGIGLAIPVKPLTQLLEGKGRVPSNDPIAKSPEDKKPKGESPIVKGKDRPKPSDDPQPQQWTLAAEGGAEITCLSFSPDGQCLATGSTDRLIRIWDVAKGVERQRFPVRQGRIDSLVFSPSGRQLALNEGISIFEIDDAVPGERLSGSNGSKIAFSADEKLIARVSGQCVRISERGVAGLRELVGFEAPILCLAFSPNSQTLATGGADKVVKLWNVRTKELRAAFTGHTDHVTDLAFAPDGRTLASASNDKTVRLWDMTTLQLRATLSGHAWGVLSVAFAPDSKTVVSCGADGLVCRWHNDAGKQIPAVRELDQPTAIRAAAFSPRRKLSATLAAGIVKFSPAPMHGASRPDAAKFQALLDRKNALTIRVGGLLRGPVVFSPKGDTLFTTIADSHTTHKRPRIHTWETMTGRPGDAMEGSAPFALTPDGRTLLFADSQSMRLRNLRNGELLREELKDRPATGEMALSPDGETVLIAYGKTVKVYDLPIRQLKKTWDHFDGRIEHVAFAPDGRTFAVALELPNRPVRPVLLCDSATGAIQAKCLGHRLAVHAMAFTPDGKRLVTGSLDRTIRLWDTGTGKEIALVGRHEEQYGEVVALAVHRAGKILASAGGDGVLNLWDLDKQKKLLALRPHPQGRHLVGAAFSADGKFLAACTDYDYVTLWDVERLLRDSAPLIAAIAEPTVTLLVEMKRQYGNSTRVLGLSADAKLLWQFDAGGIVTDAHMIGADRVLYTVDSQPLLFESDLNGKIVSSKKITGDLGRNTIRFVHRRRNGTTLCAFDYRLVEVDTRGKETVLYQRQRIGGDAITDVRVLANGTIGLVTNDGVYRLLDARGQELKNVRIIPRQEFSGGKMDVPPNGGVLVTDWRRHKVVEFDAEGKWVWEANVKTPTSVSRLPNGNTLATSQEDCCAVELDQTGKEVWRYQGKGHVLLARRLSVPGLSDQQDNVPRIFRRLTFQGRLDVPGAVAFAHDGQVLMTLASQIKIWRASDLRELEAAPLVRRSTLVALGHTPDFQTICTLDNKGHVQLYHWNSSEAAADFALPLAPGKFLAAAACSPDGKWIAGSFINERTIEIWDIAEKKLLHKLPEQPHHSMKFAFSPDGKLLVSTGGDSKVKFWDVASGREIASLTPRLIEGAKYLELGASTFSPDGKTLAMLGENAGIRLWDVEKRAVRTVVRPPADLCCLAFSADSKLLATGMRDGMLHVWDVATGTRRGSLRIDERREVRAVAFSPDGSKVAVSCGQELQLWDLRRSPLLTVLERP